MASSDLKAGGSLRAVVVGAGTAAAAMHLPVLAALRDRGHLVLSVICDLDSTLAEHAKRRFGFGEASGDAVRSIQRADCNVVYVFGSAQLHHALGLTALRAGKHVFVEKPVAPGFAEARELAEAARSLGLIAVGGHNRRFYRSLQLLQERSGNLGWRYAEAVFHKPEFAKPVPFGANTWLGANGIHALDVLVYMMGGLPEHLASQAGEPSAVRPGAFSAIMRWRDGAQGVFLCNNHAGTRREEYSFHRPGESYRLSAGEVLIEKEGRSETLKLDSTGDGVAAEHEAFLAAVNSGQAPRHSLAAIAPSLLLADMIESGFTGTLPMASPRTASVSNPQAASILVSRAAPLLPAIARILPDHRLVSLQEVCNSAGPRPDIVAALLGGGADPLSLVTLSKLPQLRIIGIVGLSVERHSPQALMDRGLTLVNASGAYADSVAEFALALAILGRRRAFASHELMRAGGWGTRTPQNGIKAATLRLAKLSRPLARTLGVEAFVLRRWRASRMGMKPAETGNLAGAAVGLIGWGGIARQFTRHLIALRARVSVYSEHATMREIREAGASPVSLAEALACDIVSLHRGLTPTTRHGLGAAELNQLRAGAVLINVARGALIEPHALLSRLARGDVFACLDTFENEPLAPADVLRRMPNVFLTSHIAGGSRDMHVAAADEVVHKVARHLQGSPDEGISRARLGNMT